MQPKPPVIVVHLLQVKPLIDQELIEHRRAAKLCGAVGELDRRSIFPALHGSPGPVWRLGRNAPPEAPLGAGPMSMLGCHARTLQPTVRVRSLQRAAAEQRDEYGPIAGSRR